jgi:hypothetical protein
MLTSVSLTEALGKEGWLGDTCLCSSKWGQHSSWESRDPEKMGGGWEGLKGQRAAGKQ